VVVGYGPYPSSVEVDCVLYSLGGFVRLREEFGTPIVDWEILHGGVGGEVELGARTSKQICVFAIDPITLNSTLLYLCKHHSFIASYIFAWD